MRERKTTCWRGVTRPKASIQTGISSRATAAVNTGVGRSALIFRLRML